MVVESLLRSMQHGYAASEMLGTCDFRSTPEGIAYLPPADSEMLRIWTKILQRPAPGSEPVTAC
jgi:hypothetical protein